MTFKHSKFEDSPIMRSLEKVAIEKGLVIPTPLTKQADSKIDLSLSVNLTENIIKLCDGLRQNNLNSYANELENNYLQYKRAQTLYDVCKETGDDLVNDAHPEGSHKIEGIEGDSIVETIIDQHLQHLKMLDKKPTGKLSTSKEIINGVKIILSQDTTSNEAQVIASLNKLLSIMQRIQILSQDEGLPGFAWGMYFAKVNNAISNPTIDNINTAKKWFNALYSKQEPGIVGGVSDDNWTIIKPLFGAGNASIEKALMARQKFNEERAQEVSGDIIESDKPKAPVASPDIFMLQRLLQNAIGTLNGYRASINSDTSLEDSDRANALAWINSKLTAVNNIKSEFEALSDDEKTVSAQNLRKNLSRVTSNFEKFYQGWIA